MRTRLVGNHRPISGKKLDFVVEKKINEMELGYVLEEGKDVSTALLRKGFAKLRDEKSSAEHIEEYRQAQENAQSDEVGIWSTG
jgi:endonuclease YncB( thermonuclease family)